MFATDAWIGSHKGQVRCDMVKEWIPRDLDVNPTIWLCAY